MHSGSASRRPLPQGGNRKREERGSSPAGPGDRSPCAHQPSKNPPSSSLPLRGLSTGTWGQPEKSGNLSGTRARGGEVSQPGWDSAPESAGGCPAPPLVPCPSLQTLTLSSSPAEDRMPQNREPPFRREDPGPTAAASLLQRFGTPGDWGQG